MSNRTNIRTIESAPSQPNFKRRRMVAAGALAVTTALGVVGFNHAKDALQQPSPVKYTQEEYKEMPQMHIVVKPGEGAEDVIRGVEPDILADPELRSEVISYIQAQGANRDAEGNPQLAQTQEVSVPAVPGMQVPQQGK